MKLFRWLRPGVHVKRWLFLFGIGMMITSFGLILTFNYEWIGALEEWTFRMLYGLVRYSHTSCRYIDHGVDYSPVGSQYVIHCHAR